MKTYLDCIPCMMYQAFTASKMATNDEDKIKQILDAVGCMIKDIDMSFTPAESGMLIHQKVKDISGVNDPYKAIKNQHIDEAISILPEMEKILNNSEDRLETAIRLAIAGNVIDLGVNKEFNIVADIKKILKQDFAIFDYDAFKQRLAKANTILYLADNSGESVFDKILIRELNKKVFYAVREQPIINDVTREEAVNSGIEEVAEIISSGMSAPGTILSRCNKEFLKLYNSVDLIISKGQGNYEGLSENNRPIFFMLKAKCHLIARDLQVVENDIVLKGN